MASTSIAKKQWDTTWAGLPAEIRLLILEALTQDGCTLSRLATVSREWQTELERHNFAQIRLTPSRLVDFGSRIHRNRALVRYIWFCLELNEYDCRRCAPAITIENLNVALSIAERDHRRITLAFQKLFPILSTWDPLGDLQLDISVYSPSDSQHWLKYLKFVPDPPKEILGGGDIKQTMLNNVFHDPRHGWVAGSQISAPPWRAIVKLFDPVMEEPPQFEGLEYRWWDQLPSVPVVTRLLLRQQNRRRLNPRALAHISACFPRLQEVNYEPWREWDPWEPIQFETDINYEHLFESMLRRNTSLKRLMVFENFNQQYPAIMHGLEDGEDLAQDYITRRPDPGVSRKVALASLKLEHLAASFVVDASQFLQIKPSWKWPNLISLALTSRLLTPDGKATEIEAMLQQAAAGAMKMPQLEIMEIWNGRKGIAALFQYQASRERRRAIITWRGTWHMAMEPSVIQAWEDVVHQHDGWRLHLEQEWLDEASIKSHVDAIHYLKLSSQVVRPISLQQIQIEQEFLEGLKTV